LQAIGDCITNVLVFQTPGLKAQSHFNIIPGLKAGAPTVRRKRRNGRLLMQGSIKPILGGLNGTTEEPAEKRLFCALRASLRQSGIVHFQQLSGTDEEVGP